MKTQSNPLFHPVSFVRLGEGHREHGINGQDHAVVGHHHNAVVLAVADGVSLYIDAGKKLHSRNEVASWIAAEVAVAASLRALNHGVPVEKIIDWVASALFHAFHPLWEEIGIARGQIGLTTTLVLAIVTPTWTGIYASGDGYWGVTLPVFDGVIPDVSEVKGEHLVDSLRADGLTITGSMTGQPVGQLVSRQARLDSRAVREALRPVLICEQLVLSAFVATDGLEDEEELRKELRRGPCRDAEKVLALIARPVGSDDLAVAYTHSRVAGMFGEVHAQTQAAAPANSEEVAHV